MHQCWLTLNTTSTDFHATSLLKFYHSTNTVPLWNIKCHYISDFFIISVANCFRANTSLYHSTSSLIWPQHAPFPPPGRSPSHAHMLALLVPNFNTLSNTYSFLKPLASSLRLPNLPPWLYCTSQIHHEILSNMSLIAHTIYGHFPVYSALSYSTEQSSYVCFFIPCEGFLSSHLYQSFKVKVGNIILYIFPTQHFRPRRCTCMPAHSLSCPALCNP